VPGNKVGVKVSEEYVLDRATGLRGTVQILSDIALRVDDRCRCRTGIGYQVRRVRQAAKNKLMNFHNFTESRLSIGNEDAGLQSDMRGSPLLSRHIQINNG